MAVLACATLVCVLFAQVVAVGVFATGLRGAAQVAVLASIVACLFGLTLATGANAHFRPTFADGIVPKRWAGRVGDAISATLFAAFTVFAVAFVMQSHAYADREPVLNIPLWTVQIVVPYVLASCAVKHAVFAISPRIKNAFSDRAQ